MKFAPMVLFALVPLLLSACGDEGGSGGSGGGAAAAHPCADGKFLDERDGTTYKCVAVQDGFWMAENLNFETKGSGCYGDSAANCDAYGRLYTWSAATSCDGAVAPCDASGNARGACPAGWHLPSREELVALAVEFGGEDWAGSILKSEEGWDNGGGGADYHGFTALPAGYFDGAEPVKKGAGTAFWSSTESSGNADKAHGMRMSAADDKTPVTTFDKTSKLSVRCVQD